MTAVVVMAAVGIAAITVILLTGVGRQPMCPAAINPPGGVRTTMPEPRLCALGATGRELRTRHPVDPASSCVVTPTKCRVAATAIISL